ncbi:MAG: hypothetical protein ACP5MZ_04020 [Candidatus Micrarchaeia archaeon]
MNTKKYPLEVHIDGSIIREGKDIASKKDITVEEGVNGLLNFIQYPYTNEDSDALAKAFQAKGHDGKPFIRDKKSMLFIAGGGAIMGSMDSIFKNNQIDRLVGIDLSSAQLCNFKYLARRAALEETKGKHYFLRRAPISSNTQTNAITIVYGNQEIDEKIFGYPLEIDSKERARRYFQIPAKGTYSSKHHVDLVKGDIVKYLKDVEASKAPDLLYISNLSEWSGGKIYSEILDTIKSEDKFALGTVIVGTHKSETYIAVKVLNDSKPEIKTYQIRN